MRIRLAFLAPLAALACSACSTSPGATRSDGTPSPVTSATDAGTDASAALACPTARPPEVAGIVSAKSVTETSGIAASTRNAGVYWVHNDSGDDAHVYALDPTGALVATLAFDTAPVVDVEDMAIEDAPDGASYLYLADIGNNASPRTEFVIHRVREPELQPGTTTLSAKSSKMTFHYADAPHDAETLLFDPRTRDLFVVTKVLFGNASVHRLGPFVAGGSVTTTRIAGLPIAMATGGAISRDGRSIAVRSYSSSAWLWRREASDDLATALGRSPCRIGLANERQGEAFAFLADDRGYVTLGEGADQALHVARFEETQ